MKERRRHGEGASAQVDKDIEKTMEEIREAGKEYGPDKTYNTDEASYFWKLKSDRSLPPKNKRPVLPLTSVAMLVALISSIVGILVLQNV
jgi:hypothetical protein